MTIKGKAAIVGIGETPHKRNWPNRTERGLCAEAAAMAIADAGLRKQDIDGCITVSSGTGALTEYMGIKATHFSCGTAVLGSSPALALMMAANAINAGMATRILCVSGGARDSQIPARGGMGMGGGNTVTEFVAPYGPAAGNDTGYGWLYSRHMAAYGTKPEQIALVAVRQRINAMKNPNAAFGSEPLKVEDVLNSAFTAEPLHALETASPCAGATAFVVTTPEIAKGLRNKPAYLLGAGMTMGNDNFWLAPDMLTTPTKISAASALVMAGYAAKDLQFAELTDFNTILAAVSLEDAGLCKKGEIGAWLEANDTTYKGNFPVNTDGGQLSAGQLSTQDSSGGPHIIEAARQISGRAGDRQVAKSDLCLVNLIGGTPTTACSLILGSANAL